MSIEDLNIIGWCDYCHSEIFPWDKYVIENGRLYHKECFKQKETYWDPLDYDE